MGVQRCPTPRQRGGAFHPPPIIANACCRPMITETRRGVSSLQPKNGILRVLLPHGTVGMHNARNSKSPTRLFIMMPVKSPAVGGARKTGVEVMRGRVLAKLVKSMRRRDASRLSKIHVRPPARPPKKQTGFEVSRQKTRSPKPCEKKEQIHVHSTSLRRGVPSRLGAGGAFLKCGLPLRVRVAAYSPVPPRAIRTARGSVL
jgi:hypothetical protein